MSNPGGNLWRMLATAIACMSLSACGGGGGSEGGSITPPVNTSPPIVVPETPADPVIPPEQPADPVTIEGVATPSSVSVVTATNAT